MFKFEVYVTVEYQNTLQKSTIGDMKKRWIQNKVDILDKAMRLIQYSDTILLV